MDTLVEIRNLVYVLLTLVALREGQRYAAMISELARKWRRGGGK